jgi:hypothetical protein
LFFEIIAAVYTEFIRVRYFGAAIAAFHEQLSFILIKAKPVQATHRFAENHIVQNLSSGSNEDFGILRQSYYEICSEAAVFNLLSILFSRLTPQAVQNFALPPIFASQTKISVAFSYFMHCLRLPVL